MITLILYIIAGFLKGIKDRIGIRQYTPVRLPDTFYFSFGKVRKTWYGYYHDAWHHCDTAIIALACVGAVLFTPIFTYTVELSTTGMLGAMLLEAATLFTAYTVSFNISFFIFKRK